MVRANLQNSKDCSDDAYHIGGEIDSRPMSMSSNDEVGARIPTVSSPTESKKHLTFSGSSSLQLSFYSRSSYKDHYLQFLHNKAA